MKQGYALSTFRLCDLTGHVELKTVCPKGTGVRIPLPAPKNTNFSVGVFLFFVLNLCAVTMGEERKTVDNCFSRTKSIKQGVGEGLNVRQSTTMRLDRARCLENLSVKRK